MCVSNNVDIGYCQRCEGRWSRAKPDSLGLKGCPWCHINQLQSRVAELSQDNLYANDPLAARGLVGLPHAKTKTSKAAAESMKHEAPTIRRRVWDAIHQRGDHGATAQELEEELQIGGNTIRPRLMELRQMGMIVPKGLSVTRKTRSGRQARVWVTRWGMDKYDD